MFLNYIIYVKFRLTCHHWLSVISLSVHIFSVALLPCSTFQYWSFTVSASFSLNSCDYNPEYCPPSSNVKVFYISVEYIHLSIQYVHFKFSVIYLRGRVIHWENVYLSSHFPNSEMAENELGLVPGVTQSRSPRRMAGIPWVNTTAFYGVYQQEVLQSRHRVWNWPRTV